MLGLRGQEMSGKTLGRFQMNATLGSNGASIWQYSLLEYDLKDCEGLDIVRVGETQFPYKRERR